MNGICSRAVTAVLVAGLVLLAIRTAPPEPPHRDHATTEVISLAHRWNIRNLVTAIYLGPRAADTFLEVMVVTLAVIGLRHLGERP